MGRKRRNAPVQVGDLRAYSRRQRAEDGRHYWQVVYCLAGTQNTVKGASGWFTRTEVGEHLAALLLDPVPRDEASVRVRTVGELLDRWLQAQKTRVGAGLAPSSHQGYTATSRQIKARLDDVNLTRVQLPTLETLRDRMLRDGLAPTTVSQAVRVLRLAWTWGRERGHTPDRDLPRVRIPSAETWRYNHNTPTDPEVRAVVAHLEGWKRLGVLMLWYTGCRVGEVGALRWRDVDLMRGELHLQRKAARSGTPKAIAVTMNPALVEALRSWGPGHPDTPVLGVTKLTARRALRDALERACKAAHVPRFTPHGLRRLASTRLMEARVSPRTYERIMGHSYAMGLRTYAQAQDSSVVQAVALLGPQNGEVIEGPWTAEG